MSGRHGLVVTSRTRAGCGRAARAILRAMDRPPIDAPAVGDAELSALEALQGAPMTLARLAEALAVEREQVAAIVDRLAGWGLVQAAGPRYALTSAGLDAAIASGAGLHDPGERAAVITPYRDGPLVVRGPFRLVDQEGREIEVRRGTIALCRCGKSRTRPFCDGTHKLARFAAPSGAEQPASGLRLISPPR
jgi:CDGSH-type Zn-finger protein